VLAPLGTVTFAVSGQVGGAGSTLVNTATVTPPTGVVDTATANNASTDTDAIVDSVDLAVTIDDGKTQVVRGTSDSYTIVATNNGAVPVAGARVTDTLPAGLINATWTCVAASIDSSCAASGAGSIDEVVTLANGGSVTFTVAATVAPTAAGTLVNTATVSVPAFGFTDDVPLNDTAQDADTFLVKQDLCASAGSTTLPDGVSVPVWGYTDCNAGVTAPGGPTISAYEGDAVEVTLHNNLSVATGVLFPSVSMPPDIAGIAGGTTKTYAFTAAKPGTSLYEAALLPGAEYQVAMGLYGAMVVLPATHPGQTYNDTSTTTGQNSTFDTETTLVLSELDPALNSSAHPESFDLRTFAPKYALINGKAYPDTAPIPAAAGDRVLVRYVNAGLKLHSMAMLGARQTIIANDSIELKYPSTVVAQTFGPGQTADVITTATTAGSKLLIYDGSLSQHNSSAAGAGGMMTFISVDGSIVTGAEPTTSNVAVSPNPSNGSADVTVTANVTSSDPITGVEYSIDTTTATPVAMTATDRSTGTIPLSVLGGLTSGTHVIYVRAENSAGWGPVSSTALTLDTEGPATGNMSLTPAISNGLGNVVLKATGNDTASGGVNVDAGNYSVDGGTPVAMTTDGPVSAVTALTANIPVATLIEGPHVVSVTTKDALGNVGAPANITLTIDKTGPAVTGATAASPSPNNGTMAVSSGVPAVRVSATFTDAMSNVVGAEGFIDAVGATGSGFIFSPSSGVWTSQTSAVFADIPLATVATLTHGLHFIQVHAKDAAGNWGAATPVTLVIDKQGPVVSVVISTPAASNDTAVVITATANDATTGGLNIAGGELFVDTAGTTGTGITMTGTGSGAVTISGTIPAATLAALTAGVHAVTVHAKDIVGNWGALVNGTLLIDRTAPTFTGVTLTPGSIAAGAASVNLAVSGATDGAGGSGVSGGEYWFVDPSIPVGTGTAFTGLTASVPTATLTAGSYAVRTRVRDVAGNWSAVQSATLTVVSDIVPPTFTSVTLTPNSMVQGRPTVNATVNGATDGSPSSGLQGGQYWFDGTVVPGNVAATAFTGMSPTIATATLAPGTHALRVRIRDNAGNWSTVRSVNLAVIADAIFASGFETGTAPWGWTSTSTNNTNRLNVTAAAALAGTRGLQAQGNNTNYVQYNWTQTTATFDAKFSFRPNGENSAGKDIFAAATATNFNTQLFHVRYRLNAGTPQVQIQVGAAANATWVNINGGTATNTLEVVWESGSTLVLYVNGVSSQTLTATNGSVASVRLGSVTTAGNNVAMFFDAFASKHSVSPLLP
jgi:hypothetical protein